MGDRIHAEGSFGEAASVTLLLTITKLGHVQIIRTRRESEPGVVRLPWEDLAKGRDASNHATTGLRRFGAAGQAGPFEAGMLRV